jgi:hypothetical protein
VQALDLAPPTADALPRLRERLGELFGVAPARVLVTAGTSGAMALLAQRYFRPGVRVATERPSYEPFRALPELHGAELAIAERRLEDGWRLDPDAVRAALGPATHGHVFVCNPHNPTGAELGAEDLLALASLAADRGGVLISNDVYMELAPNEERLHAFALAPNAFSIGSLTKAYGLGALRIGWILAGAEVADEIGVLEDLAFLDTVSPPTPSLRIALAALERLPVLLQPARAFERECKPHLVRWLREETEVEGVPPRRGLTTFARVAAPDTRELARFLAREHGVDVGPGEFFGLAGHLRIGYGVPETTLVEGLERLSAGLRAFAG